ncbi:hypothetical protein TNCV_3629021 [Trichonephila clavipes]|nr:hypothetical protein TNCV_3629021 [Trichonephila clavipes]
MANNNVLRSNETMAVRNRSPETKCLSMMKLNRIMDQQYRGSIISPRNLLMAGLRIAFTGFSANCEQRKAPLETSRRGDNDGLGGWMSKVTAQIETETERGGGRKKTNLHLISPDEIQLKSASSEWRGRRKKNSTLLLHTHISPYASSSAASQDPLLSSSICLRNLGHSPSFEETRKNILGKKMKQKASRRKKRSRGSGHEKEQKEKKKPGKESCWYRFPVEVREWE